MTRICLVPKVFGVGGMVSFQAKLTAELERRGMQVCRDLADHPYDAVLITAGTRHLAALSQARRRGVRLVQRLDGINWMHRRGHGGLRHFLRAEYGNRLVAFIRRHLADRIVYQSDFARRWWEDWFGATPCLSTIIHNGVDLQRYHPQGEHDRPADRLRLLVVEGSMSQDLTPGLHTALRLAERLAARLGEPVELQVAGRVAPALQETCRRQAQVPLTFTGVLPSERIPWLDRSAHLFFSAELLAACPNSVIEALACGLPVTGFGEGALPELVVGEAGSLAPYGGDPWKMETPNLDGLESAALAVCADLPRYARAARRHAEQALGLEMMTDRYLEALLG